MWKSITFKVSTCEHCKVKNSALYHLVHMRNSRPLKPDLGKVPPFVCIELRPNGESRRGVMGISELKLEG